MLLRIEDLGTEVRTSSAAVRRSVLVDDALQESESRFVQLPTDQPRAAMEYESAAVSIADPLVARLAHDPALAVAALAALLQRYSRQNLVGIDVRFVDATGVHLRAVDWSARAGGDEPIASLIAKASRAITPDAPAVAAVCKDAASVAATFVEGATTSTDASAATAAPSHRKYDLHFVFPRPDSGACRTLVVRYDAGLFRAATVRALLESFVLLVGAALRDRATPIRRLPILTPAAESIVTLDGPCNAAPTETVPQRFRAIAGRQPAHTALFFQGARLTYGELDERSDQLAHDLVARGVGPDVRVGVCVRPSLDVVVALLAVFKAGGVYMPLDPTHPQGLIAAMLDEAEPLLLLTQTAIAGATEVARCPRVFLDEPRPSAAKSTTSLPAPQLDRAAYLLYTSGTTGRPKGVVGTHRNLAHYLQVARDTYRFDGADVFCALARYTFSISLWELLSPLCCGGSLHLLERDEILSPHRLVRALECVTVVHAGPSLLGGLFRFLQMSPGASGAFAKIRHASSGGDLVSPLVQEGMGRTFPNAEIWVIYGCTEISCMGATYAVPRDQRIAHSLVGKPFREVGIRVVDPAGAQLPVGVVGEIWFSGPGLVPGYYRRPELDAENFVERDGRRYYRTGDLGRVHADGNLEILGRRDFQVQLRGIHIELVGIENTIRERGLAAQCAIVLTKREDNDGRLIAFVVEPRKATADITGFRRELREHLPDYMLPHGLVVVDALPLTQNGKLDRDRLVQLAGSELHASQAARSALRPGQKPRNATEQQIVAAFAAALGVSEVGIDDDFFECGGDSLSAMIVMMELEEIAGFSIPPGALFERSTPRALASLANASPDMLKRPIPLNRNEQGLPLFMLVGVHVYRALAQLLEDQYAVFGVCAVQEFALFEDGDAALSVADLARLYIAVIRRQQAEGPYRVCGMSFGGIVAFEVARQLRAAGERVEFLGMIDSVLPEPGLRGRFGRAMRLAALPWRERTKQLATRLRGFAGREARSGAGPDAFLRHGAAHPLGRLELSRERAYASAANVYARALVREDVEATLIVAQRRLVADRLADPECGWRNVVPGIDVHSVDAGHLELLQEPWVEEVAAILRSRLGGGRYAGDHR